MRLGLLQERRDAFGEIRAQVSTNGTLTTPKGGDTGVNISSASCKTTPGEKAVNDFEVTIADVKQSNGTMITYKLESLPAAIRRACT